MENAVSDFPANSDIVIITRLRNVFLISDKAAP